MGLQRSILRKPDPEPPPPAPPRARRVVRVLPAQGDPGSIRGLTGADTLLLRDMTGARVELEETPWLALLNGAIAAGRAVFIRSDLVGLARVPRPAPRARRVVRVIPSRRDCCCIIGLTARDALIVRELSGPFLRKQTPWLALLNGAIAAGYAILIRSDLPTID